MSLTAGTRLGPYEILSALGAGGMGEVYRARDTKLNRDVAIKVLRPAVANDPARLARFSREAQVLAALNHPNIAHIHGLVEADGALALALEFVDGEDLAQRILRGPLPLDEALPIAKQIAEALEAAHDQGIIHRDLKPANIKVRPDGTVKVLDFGLAKAVDPAISTSGSVSDSPTVTTAAMTREGVIIGTAAYMSPEQAKGHNADKRSDVWAFGCVVYEMLAGVRAFQGDDMSETLASVLAREPDFNGLPADMAPSIRSLIQGCLQKNRRARIADMSVVRYALDQASATATVIATAPIVRPVRSRSVSVWMMAAAVVAAAIAGAGAAAAWFAARSPAASTAHAVRFSIVPSTSAAFVQRGNDRDLAISPDGRSIAYRGLSNGEFVMFVRSIDSLEPIVLRGLTVGPRHPFFSPDGHWIGFFSTTALWKVALTGGPSLKICDISGAPRGATWMADNTIVFASTAAASGLQQVPASGGTPQTLTTPNRQAGETAHLWPSALPDGRGVLFTIRMPGPVDSSVIALFDLKSKTASTLARGGTSPMYSPSGHVVYAAGGGLRALRFDLSSLAVSGEAVPVLDQVGVSSYGAGEFDIAQQSGTLLYAPTGSGSPRSLVFVGRDGREEPVKAPPRAYNYPRLSPDGTRIGVDILDQESDIWVWDSVRETLIRLTSDPALDSNPVWMPDGRRIVFASTRDGVANMFVQSAEGGVDPERLVKSERGQFPYAVTPDGLTILFRHDRPTTHEDLDVMTVKDRSSEALIATQFSEGNADLSPDGRWLALQSTDSGRDEVYVRPFPNVGGGRWQVSTGGGDQPLWSKDGRELFYRDSLGGVMGAAVSTSGGTFSAAKATPILSAPYYKGPASRTYDISRDGRRFLMVRDAGPDPQLKSSMIVVLNWVQELKSRVQ